MKLTNQQFAEALFDKVVGGPRPYIKAFDMSIGGYEEGVPDDMDVVSEVEDMMNLIKCFRAYRDIYPDADPDEIIPLIQETDVFEVYRITDWEGRIFEIDCRPTAIRVV